MRGASQSNWRSATPAVAACGPTMTCSQLGAALATPRSPRAVIADSFTASGSMMLIRRRVEAVSMARMLDFPPRAPNRDCRVDVGIGAASAGADWVDAVAGAAELGDAPAERRALFISPATWSASAPTTTCMAVGEGLL